MDNKIEVFKNEQFGEVRTTLIGGEPWFAGKDVALVLRYSNPQKAIRDHVDEEDRTVNESFTVHGTPITIINESGLYSLIMCSRLPEAKAFKRWITHEVIPAIRKTGGYMTDSLLERIQKEPAVIVEFAQALILEKNRVKALEGELNTAKPKADVYDALVNSERTTSIRVAAKEYGIGERVFVRWCVDKKFLYRTCTGMLMPYANMKKKEWFRVRSYGTMHGYRGSHVVLTQKGKAELWSELRKDGIIKENQDGNAE